VIRMDLKIGRGKIAVQCAHAAIGASEEARLRFPEWWREWLREGQKKIALKVPGLDDILGLHAESRAEHLPVSLVTDMGLTQVAPGTVTCLGIGPAPARLLDPLTGDLPLL
jgi:peptidyl-tRNA hydrolase, PTH2 family